jgi:pimeloyl-ACP methyl ester carboxylesterase
MDRLFYLFNKKYYLLSFILSFMVIQINAQKTINFETDDSVTVTADLYLLHDKDAPFILFFHQAGWSRGEYIEIAPWVNNLGFNAMAVDQRSGGEVNNIKNRTKKDAANKGKSTKYLDALHDMMAAVYYGRAHFPDAKLIIWGSSYSSALVLKIAGEHPYLISGVLAFSPAEYFVRFGKPDDYITQSAKKIQLPVFISSARNEADRWMPIFESIPSKFKTGFIPEGKGNHGSRALWKEKSDHEEYRKAVKEFLLNNFINK